MTATIFTYFSMIASPWLYRSKAGLSCPIGSVKGVGKMKDLENDAVEQICK